MPWRGGATPRAGEAGTGPHRARRGTTLGGGSRATGAGQGPRWTKGEGEGGGRELTTQGGGEGGARTGPSGGRTEEGELREGEGDRARGGGGGEGFGGRRLMGGSHGGVWRWRLNCRKHHAHGGRAGPHAGWAAGEGAGRLGRKGRVEKEKGFFPFLTYFLNE
jgi:hypothetical protein